MSKVKIQPGPLASVFMEVENFEAAVTVWTIRVSMFCLFAALALRLLSPVAVNRSATFAEGEPAAMVGAKHFWLLGSLFSLLHALAAMGFYHQWSHWLAFEDTAQQTQSLVGIRVGVGIYFNYAFVLIWLIDSMWWVGAPSSYVRRGTWINGLVYGFLIFIAINGTIVFESGVVRWTSVSAIAVLLILVFRKSVRTNKSVV